MENDEMRVMREALQDSHVKFEIIMHPEVQDLDKIGNCLIIHLHWQSLHKFSTLDGKP